MQAAAHSVAAAARFSTEAAPLEEAWKPPAVAGSAPRRPKMQAAALADQPPAEPAPY